MPPPVGMANSREWATESGWGRSIISRMDHALLEGYATASSDNGHEGAGDDASFALGHPEKVIDFGYRAVHEMTAKAKSIIAAYYGNAQKFSYWNGCSSGGKQGLKEAQRFPADYDGIVAGAPANYWTHLMAGDIWAGQAASAIPSPKIAVIHKAVLKACDALDGITDGILDDPRRCHFDPKALQCEGADGPACLTAPEVEATRKILTGAVNPRTHEQIWPGFEPGSELSWRGLAAGPAGPSTVVAAHFKYLVFRDPNWDSRTLNFDKDVALADKLDHGTINAIDPNLKEFLAHHGKLILYHGWNDQQIAPENTVNYYNSVVAAMGGTDKISDSVRLFMAPGMSHCGGGDGPSKFEAIPSLEQWLEKGKAPDQIIAEQFVSNGLLARGAKPKTRPLCPYPQVAKYTGHGSNG